MIQKRKARLIKRRKEKSRKTGKTATMRRILRNEQVNGKEMGELRSFEMPAPCLLDKGPFRAWGG